eukprot:5471884-Amphidinium_carterae.1
MGLEAPTKRAPSWVQWASSFLVATCRHEKFGLLTQTRTVLRHRFQVLRSRKIVEASVLPDTFASDGTERLVVFQGAPCSQGDAWQWWHPRTWMRGAVQSITRFPKMLRPQLFKIASSHPASGA